MKTPIIPGIYRTSADDVVWGEIGAPFSPEDPTGLLTVRHIYPNPFDGWATIRFSLSRSAHVKAWIVRGSGVLQNAPDAGVIQANNQVAAAPGGASVLILMDEYCEVLPPSPGSISGHHLVFNLDMYENYPDGYYRCYVQADDVLLWTDFLLVNDTSCNNLLRFGLGPCD